MINPSALQQLSADELRSLAEQLMQQLGEKNHLIDEKDQTIVQKERENLNLKTLNDKLTYEMAILKRHTFGKTSEKLHPLQISLLGELVETDMGGIEEELSRLAPPSAEPASKQQPKRAALPAALPRILIKHEPDNTQCPCGCQLKRIGEDVSEKLDYTPGTFTVERHVRGKWACPDCETIKQAPVPAQVIDKGIPTSGLLAHVLIAKYADHLPLYRQEQIFERAGFAIPRSTLGDWVGRCGVVLQPLVDAMQNELLQHPVLHADESPVPMLSPGKKKTHKAYIWAYANTAQDDKPMVIYHFSPSRAGEHARTFLSGWQGQLVCDDFSGYTASFKQGVTEIGCMAHARRKFHDLHIANKSMIAEEALEKIRDLYIIEQAASDLSDDKRLQMRQEKSKPILDELHHWLMSRRQKVPKGSATAKAIDYSLNRWEALTRYCEDGAVPIDNNRVENLIRPWALGRKNWLFAGSLRSGQRAAAIMSLIQTAKLNGHEPHAYLKDVMDRLPTQKQSQIAELLPYNWQSPVNL